MKGQTSEEMEVNFVEEPTPVFARHYNQSVPETFPQASVRVLKQFQEEYPSLFQGKKEWTVDKHRKKLMDWLASHARDTALD